MHKRFTLGLSVALLSAPYAHAQAAATLDDVVVTGAPELLANYLKVSLSAQAGTPLSEVNPTAVQQEALATGFFASAQASLTNAGGKNVLTVTVAPNPNVTDVNVTGASFVSPEDIKNFLASNLNIAPGTTLNTARVEDSKEQLQQAYRENGFPFVPGVSVEIKKTDKGATLTYTVSETAPVSRVEITGATQIPADVIRGAFKPLVDNKAYTGALFAQAVQTIAAAYGEKGLRGTVDPKATTLAKGTLRVVIRELRVGRVDTSLLGNVTAQLRSQSGQLFRTDTVAQDIRTLSNQAGKGVGVNYESDPEDPTRVNLVFVPSDQVTGPIREVRVAGATVVPVADIARVLKVRLGDVYAPQLAQEDYVAIQTLYRSRGFEITTRDPIKFENGVLTYHVRETRLAGYELRFDGPQVTQPRVVLRELPPTGGVLNVTELRRAVQNNVGRLGFVVPVAEQFRPDPKNPENVTYVLTVREQRTSTFEPAISYDTLTGVQGELGLSGSNLFGLGHSYSVNVSGAPSDVGQYLSASASYTIPWLDFDFLDFRRTRTSLSVSASTTVTGNNKLRDAAGADTGRQYSQRGSGFSVSLGRRLTPNLTAGVSASTQYTASTVEPVKGSETPAAGYGTDPAGQAAAEALVPRPGLTTLLSTNAAYDTVQYPEFPTNGLRANASAGYGFGYEGSTGLSWTQYESGGRTYFGFGRTLDDGNKQQAFAVRLNAGTIVGTAPSTRLFQVGGSEPSDRSTLRGYDNGTFSGKNYFTSSLEYRYNFNPGSSFAQGIYGVLFVDAGDAWTDGGQFNVNVGYGAGVQLNLGVGNFLLPTLRFDYAFSPANPGGKFHFKLGGFF